MLEINDLDIIINSKYLTKSLSFTLNNGDKLAIIGEEGNGKSTLLKGILGICEYALVKGKINLHGNKIGYLEQTINEEYLDKKVIDFVFLNSNYYEKINVLYKYLDSLKISDEILEQEIKTLSGGEKVKIGILKLLLEENDILFLDEPTNDLDIETLKWLENFINKNKKPIIYISHDETLLENTANMILHLEQIKNKTECRHTLLKTNYATYVQNRLGYFEKQTQISKFEKKEYNKKQEKLLKIMQKVEHQQNTITRSDPHGAKVLKKKMHSLKSQERKLDSIDLKEIPAVEEAIKCNFNDVFIPKNKVILDLSISELSNSKKVLSKNINLNIVGNEHICIIGQNGIGKTTLIKEIYKILNNRLDIKVGYMPQFYDEILSNYKEVLDYMTTSKSKDEITRIRTYLGNMKFTQEEMTGLISNLSNGTKAKLFLVKLVLSECNVLILDEPTRNISPLSNPIIRNILKDFKGTIISISHDRKYIKEVIDKIYLLDEKGLKQINIDDIN